MHLNSYVVHGLVQLVLGKEMMVVLEVEQLDLYLKEHRSWLHLVEHQVVAYLIMHLKVCMIYMVEVVR